MMGRKRKSIQKTPKRTIHHESLGHTPPAKRQKTSEDPEVEEVEGPVDSFARLSLEVICQILEYLPIWDVMKLECQNLHLQEAVTVHLRLLIDVDFTEGEIHGWMPKRFTDYTFSRFISRCPELMYIYGLHFHSLSRRRQRGSVILSIPGIIEALQQLPHLHGLETSDIYLLEAVLNYLPDTEIMGIFKNRDGRFPIPTHNPISLTRSAQISSLHLIGVEVRELPRMDFVKRLHLKWVRFTEPHPFKNFTMPSLRGIVMNNCAGPQNALKYVPLMTGLVTARNLSRIEMVRVPFLGGLIHHVVEDSWRVSGFRNLHRIVFGACKHAQEADLGYLMVTCSAKLEDLYIQPSLTKDSFFYSMTHTQVGFPKLANLHLGFVDDFPQLGTWSQVELGEQGLSDYVENPAFLTDFGMKCVREVFGSLTSLTMYNCPHLHAPTGWLDPADFSGFNHVTDLCIRRCHAIRLPDFCRFLSLLPKLESLTLEQMFMEPPKGCSRVGLSAGTGLGVSSALVSDNGTEPTANQNAPNVAANGDANPLNVPNNPAPEENDAGHAEEFFEDDFDEDDADFDEDDEEEIEVKVQVDNSDDESQAEGDQQRQSPGPRAPQPSSQIVNISGALNDSQRKPNPEAPLNDAQIPESSDNGDSSECVVVDGFVWAEEHMGHSGNPESPSVDLGLDSLPGPSGNSVPSVNDVGCSAQSERKVTKQKNLHAVTSRELRAQDAGGPDDKSDHKTDGTVSSKGKSPKNENVVVHPKGKSMWGQKKGIIKKTNIKPVRPSRVSRACQCTSDDIRETTKKATSQNKDTNLITMSASKSNVSKSDDNRKSCGRASTCSSERNVSVQIRPHRSRNRKRPTMVDRSTSTSDPVIEDDHIQVLTLDCKVLVSVTLHHVGITDIVLQDCPKLHALTVSACRVLKNVTVHKASKLSRISFAQCPKLCHSDLVEEICTQPAEKYRLLFLRPVHNYEEGLMERQLFSTPSYKYHTALVHDHSPDPEETLHNRIRVSAWPDVISNLNFSLIKDEEVPDAAKVNCIQEQYPWRQGTFRTQGLNSNGSAWDLVSDLPWIQTLTSQDLKKNPSFLSSDSKAGVYSPSSRSHTNVTNAAECCELEMAEIKQIQRPLYLYPAIVYVNTCDLKGVTPDPSI